LEVQAGLSFMVCADFFLLFLWVFDTQYPWHPVSCWMS
jgi:hypothetical protein